MMIEDWFNPYDISHIKVFKHMQNVGEIPRHLVPNHIQVNQLSLSCMRAILAETWIRHIENTNRFNAGEPLGTD